MSEAKPLSAEEERWLRESVERSLATPNGDFALYSASRMAQVLATLDAERAKVEAAEARATAAEAEAERMLGLISQARTHGWLSWMSDGRRAADVADEFLARAALAKEKPDAN